MQPSLMSLISSALPPPRRYRSRRLFTQLGPNYTSRWPGFMTSVCVHLVFLTLTPLLSDQLTDPSEHQAWVRQERQLRTLRIRVPEQLYVASSGASGGQKRPVQQARERTPTPEPQAKSPSGKRTRASGRRRRFELPPLPHRADSDQSLVQPVYEAEVHPPSSLELPEVFFWAPQIEPSKEARSVVLPGHAAPPTRPRLLNERPGLDLPQPSAMTLALAGPDPERPGAFGPPDAMPIRLLYGPRPSPEAGVSADPLRGDPSAVLSVSSDPLPLREFLTIPAGNQVGRMPFSRFEGYGGAPARGRPNPDGAGSAPVENATNAQGSVGAGGDDGPLPRTEVAHSAIVQETRLDHPANGVFDVVVQSSGLEGFPESAGVLSGRPVYSVFLAVGAEREWTLQYCIPFGEEDNAEMDGGVVTLGSPQRVLAPYPRVTFRPPVTPRPTGYVMVHGYITEAGKFQDLRVLGAGDPVEQSGVLDVLERWEFRPAERGGSPVRVEVLLAIPAQ